MVALEIAFWGSLALIVWTHVGYPLALLAFVRTQRAAPASSAAEPPSVSLIIAAHDEEAVIEARLQNALALDYPRERLELIVASDGSDDRTVEIARAAGADLVLDLPRGGKVRDPERRGCEAPAATCSRSRTRTRSGSRGRCERWSARSTKRGSATRPGRPASSPRIRAPRAAARTRRAPTGGSRLKVRERESALAGVTAGNGAIYAVRRQAYIPLDRRGRPRPLVSVHAQEARLAGGLRGRRRRRGADGGDDRGRVRAQAADDAGDLGRGRARPDVLATRLRARLRLADRQPPPAALRLAVPSPGRAGDEHRPAWRGDRLPGHARRPGAAADRSPARRRVAGSPAADFPVLRPHHRLDRRRSLGPTRFGTPGAWEKAEGTR